MSDDNNQEVSDGQTLVDSIRIARDEDGNPVPIQGESPLMKIQIKVKPISYGESKRLSSFGDAVVEWDDEDKLYLLRNNLIEPNIDDEFEGQMTVENLREDMEAFIVNDLIQGIVMYGGMGRLFADEEGKVNAPDTDET